MKLEKYKIRKKYWYCTYMFTDI